MTNSPGVRHWAIHYSSISTNDTRTGFPGFLAEMKDPAEWPKSLAMLQCSDTTLYVVAAIVIYWGAGNDVASPALGSTSDVVKKVAWGIAIPTIIVAGVSPGVDRECKHEAVTKTAFEAVHAHPVGPQEMKGWQLTLLM